jgi:hypothetical protein
LAHLRQDIGHRRCNIHLHRMPIKFNVGGLQLVVHISLIHNSIPEARI